MECIEDGDIAVKEFENRNRRLKSENIHVIIMDLNMKKMDGNIATKKVKLIYII